MECLNLEVTRLSRVKDMFRSAQCRRLSSLLSFNHAVCRPLLLCIGLRKLSVGVTKCLVQEVVQRAGNLSD